MGEPRGVIRQSQQCGAGALIEWWTQSTALWQSELGTPSDASVWWQPFNLSHSIGGILLHVADVEGRWIEEALSGRPRSEDELKLLKAADNRPDQGRWVSPPHWPFSQYMEVLGWIRARSLASLREFEDPDHAFAGPNGRTTIAEAVRYLCFHEAHHAGQAVLHRVQHDWGGVEPS